MPDTTQTNIATEITRIQNDRNTIRTKLVELGMAESTANLDALATAISGITNQGAVSATVQEGDTYTIPKGYHNGSGTVSGVSGGGNYNLQSKKVTPTKSQQSVTPDSGYYGLSDVTVAAIPSNYQDVSSVTATAVTKSDITALGIPIGEDHEITFSNIATGITVPNGIGKDKCYCYTVGKLGFLSITFESEYNTSGTAIAAGKTLFYVEGVPKSIHTRYSSQNDEDGDFIAIRSSDGEQYILEATHISTGALMIKAKEAIPAGYRYKINVVFVEV